MPRSAPHALYYSNNFNQKDLRAFVTTRGRNSVNKVNKMVLDFVPLFALIAAAQRYAGLVGTRIVVPANASARVFSLAQDLLLAEALRKGARDWAIAPACLTGQSSSCISLLLVQEGENRSLPCSSSSQSLGTGVESFVICPSAQPGSVEAARTPIGLAMAIGRLLREIRFDVDVGNGTRGPASTAAKGRTPLPGSRW